MSPAADPVGCLNIAARLGVQPNTVHMWRKRGLMPPPTWPDVSGAPAWDWVIIRRWARETGRLP